MKTFIFALIAVNIFSSLACATTGDTRRQAALRRCNAKSGTLVENKRTLTGKASYYHNKFVGRTMACGGRFSQGNSTAAIKLNYMTSGLIRCGTKVLVTNRNDLDGNGNPRQHLVTITDNGPLAPGRVIDLPTSVARSLGFGPGASGELPVALEWTEYTCK